MLESSRSPCSTSTEGIIIMTTPITHIYFLLDRSGSMESMRQDVIGGFNAFLREQVADGRDAVMTLVQFDTHDPHEVIAAAKPLDHVSPLSAATFEPRGGTPLYDAMATLITEASRRAEVEDGREVVIFVTFTDGEENSSREFSKDKVFALVDDRTKKGWTFVYLGANQDSYGEGGRVGVSAQSIQDFEASADGTAKAFSSLSKGMMKERGKIRSMQERDVANFFEGDKEAEADLRGKP